jgi:hypothetical protein
VSGNGVLTKEQARDKVATLVDRFRADEPSLAQVREAQIEESYIKPLFRYLNWDTSNAGLSPAEWEFFVQHKDRRGKVPDYVLKLDGQPLVVMDAKRVAHDMHETSLMNQAYSYAYSTQDSAPSRRIDFAVLTDFQEFVLLDCTLYAAKPGAIQNFKVFDWRYDHYLSEFDTLWNLFERGNMREAAKTRWTNAPTGLWSKRLSAKKVKANRIPPNEAFLSEMDDKKAGWRITLARDMKKRNPTASDALLTAAVQLLIDRIIFVKVLSDREIEDDYLSNFTEIVERSGLAESDTSWFAACRNLFRKLNTFYNGSIFEPRPELERVAVSNKAVRNILRALEPSRSPYNFSVLPVEILGTIYERFLGYVVRATDHTVKIIEKPDLRKKGGVYYTPQYIVDYIVEHTVGKLLKSCKTPEDVAQLKILDPACGSGSFLLRVYQALIDWHINYYCDRPLRPKDRTSAYYDADNCVRLTGRLKRQILLNNVFGVDIDPQAVEVTQLSLSVKALEDTRLDELTQERTLFHEAVLPDLRNNIKCGNSLVDIDYFGFQLQDVDEVQRIKPFSWHQEFPAIMSRSGFDAVIGNPPYAYRNATEKRLKPYYLAHYKSAEGNYDLYKFFLERGLGLARERGYVGMITSASFLVQPSFRKLRRLLLECTIERLAPLGPKAFADATVDTSVLVLVNDRPSPDHVLFVQAPKVPTQLPYSKGYTIPQARFLNNAENVFDYKLDEKGATLAGRLLSNFPPISSGFEFGVGINTAYIKDRLIADHKVDSRYHRMIPGDGISRYGSVRTDGWIMYDKKFVQKAGALGRTLPAEHLLSSTKLLLVRTRNLSLPQRIVATIDTEKAYNLNRLSNIVSRPGWNLYGLLGFLNSKLYNWLFSTRFYDYEIKPVYVRAAPLADANDKKLVELVEMMLNLHGRVSSATTQTDVDQLQRQIRSVDSEIDRRVYELYSLTDEEIRIVEGTTDSGMDVDALIAGLSEPRDTKAGGRPQQPVKLPSPDFDANVDALLAASKTVAAKRRRQKGAK